MTTRQAGSTDQTVFVRAVTSAGATATPAYNDAGISLWYKRGATGAVTAITPATQTSTGAHSDGGFVSLGNGWARLDLPDAAVAAGAAYVLIGGGATAWVLVSSEVLLVDHDPTTVAVSTGGITAASIATGAIDADALAADAVAEIADGVWDEALSGHATVGSAGAALSAAGSAGDPWSTALPGAYASGTAGYLIGNAASLMWDRLTSALTTVGSIGAYVVSKLGGTMITVTAPVAAGGDVTIYIGDDYNNTDSRALDWSSAGWPNLTSATPITLTAYRATTASADWSITGTAPTAGVGTQTVRFQPTNANTDDLRAGAFTFQIEATLSSGRIVTLVEATLTAKADIA